jgi:hypothetical protein
MHYANLEVVKLFHNDTLNKTRMSQNWIQSSCCTLNPNKNCHTHTRCIFLLIIFLLVIRWIHQIEGLFRILEYNRFLTPDLW